MKWNHLFTVLVGTGLAGCAGSGAHPQADYTATNVVANAPAGEAQPNAHRVPVEVISTELIPVESTPIAPTPVVDQFSPRPPTMQATPHLRFLGTSREGRPIECLDIGSGPLTILFIATIHGSEPAGTPLMHALHDYLVAHPDVLADRRVLIVPCLNPDGFATGHRHNARGVDLNRNFPARNWAAQRTSGGAPASEPESEILLTLIDHTTPDRIISIHQPLACIDYDGPAADLAQAMSETCDLPVRKLGTRPGSLGAYAGETLGISIITLEFARNDHQRPPDELWDQYQAMLITAIRFK